MFYVKQTRSQDENMKENNPKHEQLDYTLFVLRLLSVDATKTYILLT